MTTNALDELLIAYGLSREALKRRVSEKHRQNVAAAIGTDWETLASCIAIPREDVDDIKLDQTKQVNMRLAMMRRWHELYGSKATYLELINGLMQVGRRDLSESLLGQIHTKISEGKARANVEGNLHNFKNDIVLENTLPQVDENSRLKSMKEAKASETGSTQVKMVCKMTQTGTHSDSKNDEELFMVQSQVKSDKVVHPMGTSDCKELTDISQLTNCKSTQTEHTKSNNIKSETLDSTISRDRVVEDLKHMMRVDFKKIRNKFVNLQTEVRESLRKVPLENIIAHVLGYVEVFDHPESDKKVQLLPEENLRRATSTDQLFVILQKRWNFLECDMLISIAEQFGDKTICKKVEEYHNDLKEFLGKRKLSEVPKDLSLSSCVDKAYEQVVMKLDLKDPTLREIKDLKSKICESLGIMPSTLLISDIRQGCIEITFTIPMHISKHVFGKPVTGAQREALKAASVLTCTWRDKTELFVEKAYLDSVLGYHESSSAQLESMPKLNEDDYKKEGEPQQLETNANRSKARCYGHWQAIDSKDQTGIKRLDLVQDKPLAARPGGLSKESLKGGKVNGERRNMNVARIVTDRETSIRVPPQNVDDIQPEHTWQVNWRLVPNNMKRLCKLTVYGIKAIIFKLISIIMAIILKLISGLMQVGDTLYRCLDFGAIKDCFMIFMRVMLILGVGYGVGMLFIAGIHSLRWRAPDIDDTTNCSPTAMNLPAIDHKLFVGREKDISSVVSMMASEQYHDHIININGAPGIGKSTLAIYVGYEMIRNGTPVQYINMNEKLSLFDDNMNSKQKFNHMMAHDPVQAEETKSISPYSMPFVQELLKWSDNIISCPTATVLILDNCDDILASSSRDEFISIIYSLINQSQFNLRVIVVSMEKLNDFNSWKVEQLNQSVSVQLLDKLAPEIVTFDLEEVAELVEGNPLALKAIGKLLHSRGDHLVHEIKMELKQNPFKVLDDIMEKFRTILDMAFGRLGALNSKECGYILGLFPGLFDESIGNDMSSADCLELYKRYSLLDQQPALVHQTKYRYWYKMHRLIREYVKEKLKINDEMIFNDKFEEYYCQQLLEYATIDSLDQIVLEKHNFDHLKVLLLQHQQLSAKQLAVLVLLANATFLKFEELHKYFDLYLNKLSDVCQLLSPVMCEDLYSYIVKYSYQNCQQHVLNVFHSPCIDVFNCTVVDQITYVCKDSTQLSHQEKTLLQLGKKTCHCGGHVYDCIVPDLRLIDPIKAAFVINSLTAVLVLCIQHVVGGEHVNMPWFLHWLMLLPELGLRISVICQVLDVVCVITELDLSNPLAFQRVFRKLCFSVSTILIWCIMLVCTLRAYHKIMKESTCINIISCIVIAFLGTLTVWHICKIQLFVYHFLHTYLCGSIPFEHVDNA